MSTFCPGPPLRMAMRLLRMPIPAQSPARMSAMAVPVLVGTVRPTGHAHDAAHSLADDVVAGEVLIRPGVPETGYARINDVGVEFLYFCIADPQIVHCSGSEIFQDDIGVFRQIEKNLPAPRVFQIKNQALLVAVEVHEIGALGADKRRVLPRIITGPRHFDLDDFSSHVPQQQRAERSGQYSCQIQYPNSV